MGMMKDYLMTLEELAWDAIEAGASTDEEICAYMRNWYPVELETVKEITRQMYLDPLYKEGLDNPDAVLYNQ